MPQHGLMGAQQQQQGLRRAHQQHGLRRAQQQHGLCRRSSSMA